MKKTINAKIYVRPTVIPVIMEYDPGEPISSVADRWVEWCRGVVRDHADDLYEAVDVRFE